MATPNHYDILGVRVDALTMAEATKRIVAEAASGTQACYVVKPYVEFLHQAGHDDAVARILNGAWLSLPDGVSTQWAAAYLYGGRQTGVRLVALLADIVLRPAAIRNQIPEKFGGTVFTWKLLEATCEQGLKVYLIGSPSNGIAATAAAIQQRLPKLKIVGSWPGELSGKTGSALLDALRDGPVEREVLKDLNIQQPDVILVGMGFPLQEELMAKLAPELAHGVLIGEGGTFDYESFGGQRRKAPQLVQRMGLEWLWRLGLEPSRARRQLAVPRFIDDVYRRGRG